MRMSWTWITCGMAFAIANACFAPNAEARPKYNGEFWDSYPSLKEHKDTAKCGACHGKDAAGKEDKKIRNDYGKAVGEALGAKNVMDAEKIKAALKTAEGKKSATEGKTFGELIKDGKLPGKAD